MTSSTEVSKTLVLPGTGDLMPVLAYGTWTVWQSQPGEVYNGVKYAIEAGYRHIDCAWVYENEEEVGQAISEKIADGTITRKDIFITTKVWDTHHSRDRVKLNLQKSLARLKLAQADLVLVHWPTSFKQGDVHFPRDESGNIIFTFYDIINDIWRGMEDCVKEGLTRNIGLSNFNSQQVQRVIDAAEIQPCNLQIEVNPTFTNQKLIGFAKSKGLTVSSYAPLGAPGRTWKQSSDPCAIESPEITSIAQKKKKSPAQVILRWHLQNGLAVCVKSLNPGRTKENLDLFDFTLTQEEMSQISSLNKNFRMYGQPICKDHPEFPFNIEF